MSANASKTNTYAKTRSQRRRLVASAAVACALGVLQACSGEGAVAPTAQPPVTTPAGPAPTPAPLQVARISRVSPDTLQAGAILTIDGENFPASPSAVILTVGGVQLDVRASSSTRIEAVVPVASFPCTVPSALSFRLTVGGTILDRQVTLRTATPLSLKAGDAATVLDAAQARCIEVGSPAGTDEPARYVVAVINAAADAQSVARFDLRGLGTGALANVASVVQSNASLNPMGGNLSAGLRAAAIGATVAPQPLAASDDHDRHARLLDADHAIIAGAGSAIQLWSAAGQRARLRAGVQVNDTVPLTAILNSCTTGRPVRARVVYSGAKAVVLEDIASSRAGRMDDSYRAIGAEFDKVVYPMLAKNLGDPLAMNSAMNGDGRVTMLFTRFVNDSAPGTAGYVSACNFYPKSRFAASNEDEVFYARVPGANETSDDWRRSLRSTVVHEAKHLASFAERLSRGRTSEEGWLEEATARVAEELYARTFDGGGRWKGNTGFANTLGCELAQCDDRPLIMWKHFSQLHAYLRGADSLSPFGPQTSSDVTYYASGWSLVRWAIDQYAANEGAMLKSLVVGERSVGVAGLAQLAGVSAESLLSGWAMSNAVGSAGATWNANDVWTGLASTFPGIFQERPLRGRVMTPGAFTITGLQLPAAGATYLTFDGMQGGGQLLSLTATGAAAGLRVSVVRVR
jgi:hypothetical protein